MSKTISMGLNQCLTKYPCSGHQRKRDPNRLTVRVFLLPMVRQTFRVNLVLMGRIEVLYSFLFLPILQLLLYGKICIFYGDYQNSPFKSNEIKKNALPLQLKNDCIWKHSLNI